jgi:hypothetical protein
LRTGPATARTIERDTGTRVAAHALLKRDWCGCKPAITSTLAATESIEVGGLVVSGVERSGLEPPTPCLQCSALDVVLTCGMHVKTRLLDAVEEGEGAFRHQRRRRFVVLLPRSVCEQVSRARVEKQLGAGHFGHELFAALAVEPLVALADVDL